MAVESLCREALALRQDIVVEVWQDRAIEAYAVLHNKYHLHPTLLDVMLKIHLVLYELDDREDEVCIAKPAEHIVEDA